MQWQSIYHYYNYRFLKIILLFGEFYKFRSPCIFSICLSIDNAEDIDRKIGKARDCHLVKHISSGGRDVFGQLEVESLILRCGLSPHDIGVYPGRRNIVANLCEFCKIVNLQFEVVRHKATYGGDYGPCP